MKTDNFTFLSLAVSSGDNNTIEHDKQANQEVTDNKDDLVSDSDDSVQSIPITCYGPEEKSDEENLDSSSSHKIITQILPDKVATSKLSKAVEEEHVELIPDTKYIRKRKSRSRSREGEVCAIIPIVNKRQYRKKDSCSLSCSSDDNDEEQEKRTEKEEKRRSKSRSKSKSHKSKKAKSKKSKGKKKSKKRAKSKSRTRSRSPHRPYRHHRSRSQSHSDYSDDDSSDSRRCKYKRSLETPSHRSHKDKRHRYE